MTRSPRPILPALLLSPLLAGAALAQSASSVWVGQVPTSTQPTRSTSTTTTTEQILQSYSTTPDTGGLATAAAISQGYAAAPAASVSAQGNNQAILSQFGASNTGTITQAGSGNTAQATVYGSANATSQLQSGNGNSSSITLGTATAPITGSDITTRQENTSVGGPGNTASYTVTGINGVTINSSQIGSGLSYSFSTTGTGVPSDKTITIQQLGQGKGAR